MLLSRLSSRLLSRLFYLAVLALFLVACVPISQPATPTPLSATPTREVIDHSLPTAVTFDTADGVTLTGTLYGTGSSTIILSNMGDNDPAAWDQLAPRLAEAGYRVLTYKFRYPTRASKFTSEMANQTVVDLEGAVAFMRSQGAEALVLVGASLGGMATAKVAATAHPQAMIILGAPDDLSDYHFKVEASELQAVTAPKLFIASEGDKIVPFAATNRLFELASQPKELQRYSGSAHGVQLLASPHGDNLRQRLIDFITTHAPTR